MDTKVKTNISLIWDWLAVSDPVVRSDVIFLFGGANIDIAKKGLELINLEMAPVIITTGNTGTFGNPEWKKPIAEVFADYLLSNGVIRENIFIQNKSTNTLEDVKFSLPILDKLGSINKLILVSRPAHQRRAMATFKRQVNREIELINQPCFEVHPKDLDGKELEEVGLRCLQEYDRLIKYAETGDIEKKTIPNDVADAARELRSSHWD